MDAYNKNVPLVTGTLMGNWDEQRVHREAKGVGRALTRTHVPKKHEELMLSDSIQINTQEDDTKYRIIGDGHHPPEKTWNYHYGKGVNKADTIPTTGRKQQLLEQMYLKEITSKIAQEQREHEQKARKGIFETTNRVQFVPKPLNENYIGRTIMRDQDGRQVPIERVDEDLMESNAFKERGQITSDEELRKLIDTSIPIERQQPITFWREKLDDGVFYTSKANQNTQQPFARNNEFLKTFKHYKHYQD